MPLEEDNDDEVTDAVRLVLEKDPFVKADQIRVNTRNYIVTLEGLVPTQTMKERRSLMPGMFSVWIKSSTESRWKDDLRKKSLGCSLVAVIKKVRVHGKPDLKLQGADLHK